MAQKIDIDGQLYNIEEENFSPEVKAKLALIQFSTRREQELTNMTALLQRAKNSYIESLKKEMLSQKSGFLFGDD